MRRFQANLYRGGNFWEQEGLAGKGEGRGKQEGGSLVLVLSRHQLETGSVEFELQAVTARGSILRPQKNQARILQGGSLWEQASRTCQAHISRVRSV